MEPSVLHLHDKLRISYTVPHRIFSAKVYPLQAPNGSTIIVYGHEQGIRIVWRGGKSFRPAQVPKEKPKVNGSSKEDAMLLDSDDDESAAVGVASTTDFDGDEEERDSSEPYHKIVRHLDIPCGTGVRLIAIPHIPAHIQDSAPGAFPPILLSNIVVAAACNDNSIRIVTLPLLPPPPSVDGTSYKALQIVTIAGINTHHEVPSSIAITHSAVSDSSDILRDSSRSRSRSRNPPVEEENATTAQSGRLWCFLIVSISPTTGGLLLTHQIPITADTQLSTSPDDLYPLQRCYLRFPCLSSNLVFHPSAFPADRHSTVLLSATDAGCVKLYQVLPGSHATLSRGRRNSAATTDSANSSLLTSPRSMTSNGQFLLTLYPGFVTSSSSSSLQRRKHVHSATWAASGRAIIALLEDGEWGVWDLEGAGPGSGSANLLRGQSNMSGIQGGALTRFAFSSRVTPTAETLPKTRKPESRDTKDGALAPMTPHTRRIKSEGLFKGGPPSLEIERDYAQSASGHICITEHVPSTTSALSSPRESLVITYGSEIVFVSSLQTMWRAETSTKGTFDSVEAIRPSHFPSLALGQERLVGIAELLHSPPRESRLPFAVKSNQLPDILIVADHRLIFFVTALTEPTSTRDTEDRFPLRLSKPQESQTASFGDQALLRKGQLDLEGMDRVLTGMGHGDGTLNGRRSSFGKSVAFDLDDEGDLSMTSPTPKAGGRYTPTPRRPIGRNS
ncbi:hypothetical protein EPUS_04528 [Endocarpon pusillum Z07020]|uniref:Nucleoporin NUP37 n=1 Tax=Endocarpon pusillum (strain Z07020 / HMAS-L-300199) TaxID=1263415 RepID=U1GAZ5_ENDPU|nr:uncharacterized protein EPUS_04528 [Endocarpon pusillum Z07020]ERF68876.1 hypothetical protein EPUS_04528 [Endocarpon pusillum Z07020]